MDGSKKSGGGGSGGFQSLGLPKELLRGILNMGYKVPTPVQRKTLPVALAGHDLVCMARTGSGKTAAFLVPLFAHLGVDHRPGGKVRGLVLSPTRELALQTLRFARQMAKHTTLRSALVVGGDGMEAQFESLASSPDLLIATPGRLVHQLEEAQGDLRLDGTEFIVFDEADRLFEMGFAEQLRQLLVAVPEQRQCLLFSATMPRALVHFARAGLSDPQLIRLDTDTKVSEQLRLAFFAVRTGDKAGALLFTLRTLLGHGDASQRLASSTAALATAREEEEGGGGGGEATEPPSKRGRKGSKGGGKGSGKGGSGKGGKGKGGGKGGKGKGEVAFAGGKPPPLTVVFAATRHHCEFLAALLAAAGFRATVIYGTMDQEARKANLDAFRKRAVPILVVTDVAARGIDIPLLDHVVNYSFPPNPKLFVHRVGRTARQGKAGLAVSLVEPEEMPYMVDLHLFLGLPLKDTHTPVSTAPPPPPPPPDDDALDSDGGGGGGEEAAAGHPSAPHAPCPPGPCASSSSGGYGVGGMLPSWVHYGSLPQGLLDGERGSVLGLMRRDGTGNLDNLSRVCANAMKQYRRTRPDPSSASIKRAKQLASHRIHPLLLHHARAAAAEEEEDEKVKDGGAAAAAAAAGAAGRPASLASSSTVRHVDVAAAADYMHLLGRFRPKATVFEVDTKSSRTAAATGADVMKGVRQRHRISQGLQTTALNLQAEVVEHRSRHREKAAAAAAVAREGEAGDGGGGGGGGGKEGGGGEEEEEEEEEGPEDGAALWAAYDAAEASAAGGAGGETDEFDVEGEPAVPGGGASHRRRGLGSRDATVVAEEFEEEGEEERAGAFEGEEKEETTKRRMSKAERKRLARGGGAGSSAPGMRESGAALDTRAAPSQDASLPSSSSLPLPSSLPSSSSHRFRDPSFYIDHGLSAAQLARRGLEVDPSAAQRLNEACGLAGGGGGGHGGGHGGGTSGGLDAVVAGRLEEGMLDITADEGVDMQRQSRVHQWDKRKKKYVTTTLGELADNKQRGTKKMRTESGVQTLAKRNKDKVGELYAKWQAKTKRSIGSGNPHALAAAGEADEAGGGGGTTRGLGARMPLPKNKQAKHMDNVAAKAAAAEAHRHRGDELQTAKQIKETRAKKEQLRIKNLPKDKRRHVVEKKKAEWKAKVASKVESLHTPWAVNAGSKKGRGGKRARS